LFRGPPGLSPIVAPEHLKGICRDPTDAGASGWDILPSWLLSYSVGTRWWTRGSSPRSLGGVWYSSKVLFAVSSLCEAFISAGLGGAVRMCRHWHTFGAYPGGVVSRRAPEPCPFEAIGTDSPTFPYVPLPSLRGTGGEVSVTLIERVANRRFHFKLLSGGSSGRPCPVR
jgi:hypothetical protein